MGCAAENCHVDQTDAAVGVIFEMRQTAASIKPTTNERVAHSMTSPGLLPILVPVVQRGSFVLRAIWRIWVVRRTRNSLGQLGGARCSATKKPGNNAFTHEH